MTSNMGRVLPVALGYIVVSVAVVLLQSQTLAERTVYLLDSNWRFELNGDPLACHDPNTTFPVPMNDQQCLGLTRVLDAQNVESCESACCQDNKCQVRIIITLLKS